MSIEISNETKQSVEVIKEERTSRIEMFTEKEKPYTIKIHREIAEIHDGILVSVSNIDLDIKDLLIDVTEVMASNENVEYLDIEGNAKTFPIKDFPLVISAYCDKAISDKKAKLI